MLYRCAVPQVYRYFMTGDDGKCEEVDGRQAAEFEARAAGITEDTERLRAVSAHLHWHPLARRTSCPHPSHSPMVCSPAPPSYPHPHVQSNDALRAEIERLRGEPSPLLAARSAKEETLADKEKFLKLLDNLQVRPVWALTANQTAVLLLLLGGWEEMLVDKETGV